jgi:hypothetical protein
MDAVVRVEPSCIVTQDRISSCHYQLFRVMDNAIGQLVLPMTRMLGSTARDTHMTLVTRAMITEDILRCHDME